MPIPKTFEAWQIPCTLKGTFKPAFNGTLRSFDAHLVNLDTANNNFAVRLFVEGSASWETDVKARIIHGSGKSSDVVAVENALALWAGCPIVATILEED